MSTVIEKSPMQFTVSNLSLTKLETLSSGSSALDIKNYLLTQLKTSKVHGALFSRSDVDFNVIKIELSPTVHITTHQDESEKQVNVNEAFINLFESLLREENIDSETSRIQEREGESSLATTQLITPTYGIQVDTAESLSSEQHVPTTSELTASIDSLSNSLFSRERINISCGERSASDGTRRLRASDPKEFEAILKILSLDKNHISTATGSQGERLSSSLSISKYDASQLYERANTSACRIFCRPKFK